MRRYIERAEAASRVTRTEADTAAQQNLYQRLGHSTFVKISTEFYNQVFDKSEPWFRSLFASTTRQAAIQNQYEFLIQTFGGPPLYKERRGHTAILGRHGPYPITEEAAVVWLRFMEEALKTAEVDEESSKVFMTYFKYMARYIVVGRELINVNRQVGYFAKHDGAA